MTAQDKQGSASFTPFDLSPRTVEKKIRVGDEEIQEGMHIRPHQRIPGGVTSFREEDAGTFPPGNIRRPYYSRSSVIIEIYRYRKEVIEMPKIDILNIANHVVDAFDPKVAPGRICAAGSPSFCPNVFICGLDYECPEPFACHAFGCDVECEDYHPCIRAYWKRGPDSELGRRNP